jgi:hypothetical protein
MQITFDVGLKYANIMILAAVLDVLDKRKWRSKKNYRIINHFLMARLNYTWKFNTQNFNPLYEHYYCHVVHADAILCICMSSC